MSKEEEYSKHYPFDRKPILVTDMYGPYADVYEGIIYLCESAKSSPPAVSASSKCVTLAVSSCDASYTALVVQWFPLLFLPVPLSRRKRTRG